ncbi:MAG: hypothetical protein DME75_13815, partial [Verrucomicrobia bacterium]
ETLREWKTEGRLLPENEARRVDVDPAPKPFGGKGEETPWTTAAEIPGLFVVEATVSAAERLAEPPAQLQRRSFAQILVETFRVYRKGFVQFLSLTLLVVLPSVCGQLATAWLQTAPNMNLDLRSVVAGAFGFCMMLLTLLLWPIYIAGIQILTAEFVTGRRIGFITALNEAMKFWPRVAVLCVFVYGVFFLLTVFAFGIATMVLIGASSLFVVSLALALLVLQVWMFGRFFINVLFWQQFAVLENAGVVESLRESRKLARSGRDLPWFRRPLWRGVFIASIWFAFVLAITLGPESSTLQHYFNEMMTTQDPQALLQKLTASQQAHSFDIFSFSLNLVQRILQPLLGIAFVLLYLDSKTRDDQS